MRAPFTETPREGLQYLEGDYPADRRPTMAVVDLNALTHNYKEVLCRCDGRKILAVVKAQAYGHGAVKVARHLLSLGADMLGVALVEEGKELRDAGIEAPILVMGSVFPDQAEEVARLGLSPAVYSLSVVRALSVAAVNLGVSVSVHVKVDTGMGRLGVLPESASAFIEEIKSLKGVELQGLMTHFADADLRDKQFCADQMDRFESLLKSLQARGIEIPLRHAANSAAVLDYRRALFTMVRPGIMLYGYNPLPADIPGPELHPVLSLTTRIAFLKKVPAGTTISYGRTYRTGRESLIATLPVGYADGYPRSLSNRGEAIVRGVRVPIAGRVCMDMCMLDVTGVPDVGEQDAVVLIGKEGRERISADDIAEQTGTIAYEVLCGIGSRVPRLYVPSVPA